MMDAFDVDIAIIGSGFSGLAMAIRLKQEGIEDFTVLERGDDVGGTWHFNTYPGCACDVPSHLYSFSFAPNPGWSETYSRQPEIRDYLRRVADEYDVRARVRFNCTVSQHRVGRGHGRLDGRDLGRAGARARVSSPAWGRLRSRRSRHVEGLEDFEGETFHSARWNHDYDLTGKRVAAVGTGASAIQFVPEIQREVAQLHVIQRTAPWVMPHPNRPIRGWERALYHRFPAAPEARARRHLRGARAVGARVREAPEADAAPRADRALAHAQPDLRPGAAREGHAELHDRLQADPAVEQVVPRARASPTSSS